MAQAETIPTEEERARAPLIAQQNDAFRTSGNQDALIKEQIVMTHGVATSADRVTCLLSAMPS